MADLSDPNQEKITMAILGERLSALTMEVKSYNGRVQVILDKHESRIAELDTVTRISTGRIDSNDNDLSRHERCMSDLNKKIDDEVKTINTEIVSIHSKYNVWSGVNSTLAIIAGAIGSIFGVNK